MMTKKICFSDLISNHMNELNNGFNVLDQYKNHSLDELKVIQENDQFPFHVLFFNLTGELNLGSMVRTACLSGAKKAWIFGRRKFDRRGLVGANNYIKIEQVNGFEDDSLAFSVDKLNSLLTDNNLVPVIVELGGNNLGSFDWNDYVKPILNIGKIPVLIMGNEGTGFTPEILNFLENYPGAFKVSIPQRGVMRSFNVGHALSMIIWDMRKDMGWF